MNLLCSGNWSEFYFLDELYGNELVFVLSFFSSNNTDVETIYPTVHKVCLWFLFSQLWKLEEKICFFYLLCFLRDLPVFLLLTHDEFFDTFHWKKFRLKTVCLFRRLIIGKFIRKSCFLDCLFACCWLLRKLWTSSVVRTVDFLSVLSEWVRDWSNSASDSSPG